MIDRYDRWCDEMSVDLFDFTSISFSCACGSYNFAAAEIGLTNWVEKLMSFYTHQPTEEISAVQAQLLLSCWRILWLP